MLCPSSDPIRPINDTTCDTRTYAEWIWAHNSSLGWSAAFYFLLGLITLGIFAVRFFYNTNVNARITLAMFGMLSFNMLLEAYDPEG